MITTSTNPYFDDYDESKKFQRILFRPGYAVQARELTQAQTIIQAQVERFGKHVFEEGSLVTGGQFDIDNAVPYVVLNPTIPGTNTNINLDVFEGKIIQGTTTGVRAVVLKTGNHILYLETGLSVPVLFVRYTSGGQTTDQFGQTVYHSQFTSENIQTIVSEFESSDLASVSSDPLALGKGSLFSIQEGTVFTNGFFANFSKQSVVIDAFSQSPTCRVGFVVESELVTSDEDESLLDIAQGYPNYAAPGADRLKLDPILTRLEIDDVAALPGFVELFTIQDGVVQRKFERSQYAIIGDEIAKRTFDESGDYCVRGMGVSVREHLNTGVNEGYLTASEGGDSSLLAIGVDPGLAYVKGYEVGTLITKYTLTPKSTSYKYINSQILSSRSGSYILIKEVVGMPILDKGTIVSFYNTAEQRVTNRIASTADPTGSAIGTAKVKSVVYENGTAGTSLGAFRVYLYDIKFTSGNLSNARALYIENPAFFADIITTTTTINGITVTTVILQEAATTPLLYNVGSKFTRTIRSESGESDTTFTFQRTDSNISIDSNGNFSISVSTPGETFGYGAGTLSSFDKQTIFLTLAQGATVSLPGTVSGTLNQYSLTGDETYFSRLNVGDKIQIEDVAATYTIVSITNDTTLTVDQKFIGNFTGKLLTKVFLAGDHIDLNSKKSSDGSVRSVVLDASTALSCSLGENFGSSVSASVSYLVSRNAALEIAKKRRSNRYVKINCSTYAGDLTKAISLGFSDVISISEILKSDDIDDFSNATNVTNLFIFDNGQRDDLYDHATITATQSLKLTTADRLLIKLDYFVPDFTQGVGYFSVDSYPVDDTQVSDTTIFTHEILKYKSVITGNLYDLRDYMDFRPVMENTATDATTIFAAEINPAKPSVFTSSTNGLRIPFPSSQILIDYSYYLARRDVVVLDVDGNFNVIQGVSAVNPVTPDVPDNVMGVAKIFIPPYPSLSNTYARIIKRADLACEISKITFARYTMRDIGAIKQRVDNLEYYNSVNLLEKSATDLKVLDEDGLDRFKNGVFVDGFLDHSLGATDNSDYHIAVDPQEQVLRPMFDIESFAYDYNLNASVNIQRTGKLLTLPYTETMFLEQPKATTYRNIEQSVFRYIGKITLTPDTDSWVDTKTYDKTVTIDLTQNIPPFQTLWNSWTSVTGYNVYQQVGGWTGLKLVDGSLNASARQTGTYTDYASALAAVRAHAQYSTLSRDGYRGFSNGALETITTDTRTGLNLQANTVTDTDQLGSFVTDVSLVTYIRPQIIKLYVKGVKPNTLFHVFFDDENMNQYLTPMVIPPAGINYATLFLAEGSKWMSDAYGELLGYLRLPDTGKRFRVGTKEVRVTDSPTNAIDATSYAEAYFVAQGLIQQKQNTVISTKATVVIPQPVSETRTIKTVQVMGPSCMAYSFYVQVPADEDGVFLTSVDVWIQALDANLGVWFEIREMNSAGGITRTQVPYSEVWMKRNDSRLKISTDGIKNYTRVNFESPVFLMNNTQYAFVIHTEGLNPNTYFWVSRLGENDVVTGQQVTARQLTGNVYTTNNNLNWDIVPDLDLKIKFNRAKFNTAVTGLAMLGNVPYEFFELQSSANAFVYYGEKISGSQKLVLTSITGSNTIQINDVLTGLTSGATGSIVNIISNNYYTTGTAFVVGETITVEGKNNTAKISAIEFGSASLLSYDRTVNTIRLIDSNGKFFEGAVITDARNVASTTITTLDKFNYETVQFNPNYLIFKKTTCDFDLKAISSDGVVGEYQRVIPRTNFEYAIGNSIFCRSIELSTYSGNNSSQARATLKTSSNWVSPVLDLSRTNAIFVSNKVNDDITGEDRAKGGNLLNKYISKTVTLAEGQDAEDLLVSITGYCPPSITDLYPVKAWMKIWNSEDTAETIEKKNWIELDYYRENVYSSLSDIYDFKSIDFKIPPKMMLGSYGEVQYSNAGTIWKAGLDVDVDQILYVIDDKFESGELRYRHYKVITAGTTGSNAPIHLTGSATNGTAVLRAQYEAFGNEWSSMIGEAVKKDQILYAANNGGDGYRHYQVTTAGTLAGGPPTFTKPTDDPDTVYGNVYVDAYLPVNGNLYSGFKQFAVKIGLLGTNSAIVPRVGDLRVIALQM